jgi:hypothetical protein
MFITSLCWAITPSPNLGFVPFIGKVSRDISLANADCQSGSLGSLACLLESAQIRTRLRFTEKAAERLRIAGLLTEFQFWGLGRLCAG